MTDVSLLLHTMVQLSPQLFLTGVATEHHLNWLFNLIALTNNSSTDCDGNYCVSHVNVVCGDTKGYDHLQHCRLVCG